MQWDISVLSTQRQACSKESYKNEKLDGFNNPESKFRNLLKVAHSLGNMIDCFHVQMT